MLGKPTLDEELRYIDIHFDSLQRAERDMIAAGLVSPFKGDASKGPTPRGLAIATQAYRLIAETVFDEGLNPAVIKSASVRQAYADLIARPPARREWHNREPWGMT
jgi:hypothetical protein